METAWALIGYDPNSGLYVIRSQPSAITIASTRQGEWILTCVDLRQVCTATATLGNALLPDAAAIITATPGNQCGLAANQVRVQIANLNLTALAGAPFSLALGYRQTFYVQGRHLYDPWGERVVLRGVNKMAVYKDDPAERVGSFPEIRQTGANAVRIVWGTERLRDQHGTVVGARAPDNLRNLDTVIQACRDNHMIALVELHDATGVWENLGLAVDYWSRPDVVSLVQKHESYLLINIANEAGNDQVTNAQFLAGYLDAIRRIRRAGVRVPLVIDPAEFGQWMPFILDNAPVLLAEDTNLMFSLHLWWSFVERHPDAVAEFSQAVQDVVRMNIPFIVGEFSGVNQDCGANNAPWQEVLTQCQQNGIGWFAWEWGPGNENGGCPDMNMTADSTFATLQPGWARQVALDHPYSIRNTSVTPAWLL